MGLDFLSRRLGLLIFFLCIYIKLKGRKSLKSFIFFLHIFIKRKRGFLFGGKGSYDQEFLLVGIIV
jgi:hypothetical protein